MQDAPADPWKVATLGLLLVVLLPVLLVWWLATASVRLALRILTPSWGSHPGGRSLLDELILHRIIELGFRRREQLPCYHLLVDTGAGHRLARQEGEFLSAQPIVGHEVALRGRVRDGVLVIRSGVDRTIGVRFTRRGSPYLFGFVALVGVTVAILVSV
jgi:hypothetical protein